MLLIHNWPGWKLAFSLPGICRWSSCWWLHFCRIGWQDGPREGIFSCTKQIYLDVLLRGSWSHATVEGLCNHLPPTKCRICCQTAFYCHPIQRPAIVAPDRFLAQEKHRPLNRLNRLNRLQNVAKCEAGFLPRHSLDRSQKGAACEDVAVIQTDLNHVCYILLLCLPHLATLQKEFDHSF